MQSCSFLDSCKVCQLSKLIFNTRYFYFCPQMIRQSVSFFMFLMEVKDKNNNISEVKEVSITYPL